MLDTIMNDINFVAGNSNNVKIHPEKIEPLIEELKMFKNEHYFIKNPFGVMDFTVEELINFILLYDSIDFSFWGDPKWAIQKNQQTIDGGYALLAIMIDFFKENKNPFQVIKDSSFEQLEVMFQGNVEIPLLKERITILKNVSSTVLERMNGNFYKAIFHMTTDLELFQFLLEQFPNFKDERTYQGKQIHFYKLAQLLTSDILHIRSYKETIAVDYSHLIGCADYKIPQVLRNLGILEYSEELEQVVDSKQEILENDPYEIEIRANMLAAINLLYYNLNEQIARIDINDFIWSKGKNKIDKPYHLTRTTSY